MSTHAVHRFILLRNMEDRILEELNRHSLGARDLADSLDVTLEELHPVIDDMVRRG